MTLSAIVATAKNGVIGQSGSLPWYLPADLAHFKQITWGHPIIMGRKTHESIGRALPGRKNIVITKNRLYLAEGCDIASSFEEAVNFAGSASEIFIIGGESIYKLAMPKITKIYLTRVDANIPGDKYFYYEPGQWRETKNEKHLADDKNKYPYEFVVLERKG